MMKVSFKDDFKNTLVFQDKVTIVTLTGNMVMDLEHVPHDIWTWALEHSSVDINVTYNDGKENWIIKASGKAKCHTNDTPNPVIGERIAESRAKIRIYKFMYTLTRKLINYHTGILVGSHNKVDVYCSSSTSLADVNHKYYMLWETEDMHLEKLMKDL